MTGCLCCISDFLTSVWVKRVRAPGQMGARCLLIMTIVLSCFNERRPLPVQTGNKLVHGRDENLTLGPETDDALISKDGIIREIDATLYVTVEVARDIAYWLLNQVSQFEHIQNALTTSNQAGDK